MLLCSSPCCCFRNEDVDQKYFSLQMQHLHSITAMRRERKCEVCEMLYERIVRDHVSLGAVFAPVMAI